MSAPMRLRDRLFLALPVLWLLALAAAVGIGSHAAAATEGPGAPQLRRPEAGPANPGAREHGGPAPAAWRRAPPPGPAVGDRQPPTTAWRRAPPPGPAVVDRILGELAVLVGLRGEVVVPLASLPAGIEEGTVLTLELRPWPEEAERRRTEQQRLRARLSLGDDGGDIAVGAPW